jgi:hypothetical protein
VRTRSGCAYPAKHERRLEGGATPILFFVCNWWENGAEAYIMSD